MGRAGGLLFFYNFVALPIPHNVFKRIIEFPTTFEKKFFFAKIIFLSPTKLTHTSNFQNSNHPVACRDLACMICIDPSLDIYIGSIKNLCCVKGDPPHLGAQVLVVQLWGWSQKTRNRILMGVCLNDFFCTTHRSRGNQQYIRAAASASASAAAPSSLYNRCRTTTEVVE